MCLAAGVGAFVIAASAAGPASAALQLTINGNTWNDTDNDGIINFNGTTGGFTGTVSVRTQSTAPAGSFGMILTLDKVDLISASGDLVLTATDDAFVSPGGTSPVTLSGNMNVPLQMSNTVTLSGNLASTAFGSIDLDTNRKTDTNNVIFPTAGNSYTASITAVIDANTAQPIRFISDFTVVPLPASGLLLFGGLGALGFVSRRRRAEATA